MLFEVNGVIALHVGTEVTAENEAEAKGQFMRLMREYSSRSVLDIDSVGDVEVWDINEVE